MESVYRLLSKDVHSRLDRHHSVNRNCLFVGNGDCSHSCVGAVCEHQSVKADLPLLYLDLSWYATARPIVYCVFGLMNVGLVLEPFLAAVIVFALNEGAYGAETVRASLESVPSGQLEAGQCAGLFISTNDFQNRFATGDAYGVSVLVQCIDFHVKGYFIGSDYYRNGNV